MAVSHSVYQRAVMMYRVTEGLVPQYLSRGVTKLEGCNPEGGRVTRGQTQGNVRPCPSGNEWGRRRLAHHGAYLWNSLPSDVKTSQSLNQFKSAVRNLVASNHKFYRLKISS